MRCEAMRGFAGLVALQKDAPGVGVGAIRGCAWGYTSMWGYSPIWGYTSMWGYTFMWGYTSEWDGVRVCEAKYGCARLCCCVVI